MMKRHLLARALVSFAASAALVVGLVPTTARATETSGEAVLAAPARSSAEIDEAVRRMLSAGEYVPDQAIVCVLMDDGELSAQSDGLLAGAGGLSSVTARQYVEATGEALPAMRGALTSQAQNDEVQILLVQRDDMGTESLLRELLNDPRVLSAEPNYVMDFVEHDDAADGEDNAAATGEDTMVSAGGAAAEGEGNQAAAPDLTSYQWSSAGVASTVPQYTNATNPGINVPSWNQPGTTNASGVVVIMDSGVDYTHPDLVNVMYHFSPELQAQLGCGEFGYAPAREDKTNPMDGLDHGTHCAGIVAAEWNGFGVSGVASGAQLCAVSVSKSLADSAYCYDSVIKGYDFMLRAIEAGVDIRAVNRSLGLNPTNNANEAMMQAAGEAGIVTCIASGNEDKDLDTLMIETPTSQPNPYVVRVNAASLQDDRAVFSCYGSYTTTLFSPGVGILSTVPTTIAGTNYMTHGGVRIAACEEGLFLVGRDLDALLPEGTGYTDTFLLRTGATAFEPYARTLSFAPIEGSAIACANGWLYAFASSNYEEWPVFGRATRYAEPEPGPESEPEPTPTSEPEPTPTPEPTPQPEPTPAPEPAPTPALQPDPTPQSASTQKAQAKLPQTGDLPATSVLPLASLGLASIALARRMRRQKRG